jgi:hypothetical protein
MKDIMNIKLTYEDISIKLHPEISIYLINIGIFEDDYDGL